MSYTILSDPGNHLLAAPDATGNKVHSRVNPGVTNRLSITLITDAYLRTDAAGLVGTSDTATLKAHITFRAHRNKDGLPKTISTRYIMTLGNF